MATSRRNFLRVGTLCALGAGVPAVVANAVAAGSQPSTGAGSGSGSANEYTKDIFASLLNTKFQIDGGPRDKVEVTLKTIVDIKATAKNPARISGSESFSLLFVDSSQPNRLMQDTYTIEHEKAGTFTLFLVPIERHEKGHYQAIITRS